MKSKREDQIRAAHDEAMFGASVILPSSTSDDEADAEAEIETKKKELNESDLAASLLSEKVKFSLYFFGWEECVCTNLMYCFLVCRFLQNNKALGVIVHVNKGTDMDDMSKDCCH